MDPAECVSERADGALNFWPCRTAKTACCHENTIATRATKASSIRRVLLKPAGCVLSKPPDLNHPRETPGSAPVTIVQSRRSGRNAERPLRRPPRGMQPLPHRSLKAQAHPRGSNESKWRTRARHSRFSIRGRRTHSCSGASPKIRCGDGGARNRDCLPHR